MTRIRFLLLGQSGVGKSSLLKKFTSGQFSFNIYPTVGQAYELQKLMIEDQEVALQIFDMAGIDVFQRIWRQHYSVADVVLLVYDVTNKKTFFSLPDFLKDLRNYNLQAEVLLVGNKNDVDRKEVTVSMIEEFAAKENLEYIETSAKTGENVDKAFFYLAKKFLFSEGIISKKPESPNSNTPTGQGSEQCKKEILEDEDIVKLSDTTPEKSGCSC